ncbi:MAG TPA: response regulator, partial [Planctomycetota bacterium]|nr:response regulator [Planctomycetota bacterium]
MTSTNLRVLIVEDSEDDVELILIALRRGAWNVTHARVDTHDAMAEALDTREWDLIIADYSMPFFSGPAALALAMERTSGVPFILISGVVSEETAVQAMKAGADDYFSKGNFARLVPAVRREMHQAESTRSARALERQLRERESHLAHALQLARVGTWHLDIRTSTAVWSDEACRIVGLDPRQAAPAFGDLLERLTTRDRAALTDLLRHPVTKPFAQDL